MKADYFEKQVRNGNTERGVSKKFAFVHDQNEISLESLLKQYMENHQRTVRKKNLWKNHERAAKTVYGQITKELLTQSMENHQRTVKTMYGKSLENY